MKNKVKCVCDIKIDDYSIWKGDNVELLPNKTYELKIDYPFNFPSSFKIKSGKSGLSFFKLVSKIKEAYRKKYDLADRDEDDGYWHGIEDLVIEGIYVDHKSCRITLAIGS